MIGLTDRQREALRAFVELERELGAPPTIRELGARLGVSNQAATQHVTALIKKGRLRRQEPLPGQHGRPARALRVVDASEVEP